MQRPPTVLCVATMLPRTNLYRRTPCRALIYSTDMLLLLLLTFAAAAAAVVVVIDRVMC